jgi:hypothetical protein
VLQSKRYYKFVFVCEDHYSSYINAAFYDHFEKKVVLVDCDGIDKRRYATFQIPTYHTCGIKEIREILVMGAS